MRLAFKQPFVYPSVLRLCTTASILGGGDLFLPPYYWAAIRRKEKATVAHAIHAHGPRYGRERSRITDTTILGSCERITATFVSDFFRLDTEFSKHADEYVRWSIYRMRQEIRSCMEIGYAHRTPFRTAEHMPHEARSARLIVACALDVAVTTPALVSRPPR